MDFAPGITMWIPISSLEGRQSANGFEVRDGGRTLIDVNADLWVLTDTDGYYNMYRRLSTELTERNGNLN